MYTKAIVRRPGRNFANGIGTSNLGHPDFGKALEQHAAYCDALTSCGVELTVLEAGEGIPGSSRCKVGAERQKSQDKSSATIIILKV